MSADKTEQLIETLSQELKPVRVLSHPLRRALPVLILSLVYTMTVTALIGIRDDIGAMARDLVFTFELALSFILAISAGLASFWLNIPDSRGYQWLPVVPVCIAAIGLIWTFARFWAGGMELHVEDEYLHHCILNAALLGFVPAAAIVYQASYGATTRPYMLAALHVFFVLGLGYIALTVICDVNDISHAFLYHLLPFAFFGGLLGLAARRLYRW